ncbi:MAG: hypothetical protein II730_03080 [Bacteroidales bacterium]|nr:hypothetical protein [Bacteroidales bacterium]
MGRGLLHIVVLALLLQVQGIQAFGQEENAIDKIKPLYRPLAQMFSVSPEQYPTAGNTVHVITDGLEKLDLLGVDMMEAKDYIHMEYFEFFRDPGSRLVRMAMNLRGEDSLEVRYIVEDFMDLTKSVNYFGSMKKHGVEVGHYSLLRLNRRNHQKIVVIDGKVGYTGGMNIGNHYFYSWDDTHLRLTGPCVESLEGHFQRLWDLSGGKKKPSVATSTIDEMVGEKGSPSTDFAHRGDSDPEYAVHNDAIVQIVASHPGKSHMIMDGYIWLLDNCKDYILLQTPYFTPPKQVREAMKRAVERGVEVCLVLPDKSDMHIVDPANKSYYKECLENGVKIYQSSGKFNHSKLFVCDDYVSSVGSANVDGRSMKINHELNTYMYDPEIAAHVKGLIQHEIDSKCVEISMEDVESWSCGRRFVNGLARILAPQL